MAAQGKKALFLITGPSGSGKTTVAALLARRFERGVHLEGDVFRRSIVAGRFEMAPHPSREALEQLRLRYRLAATAADAYFDEDFTVALEDVVAGPMLAEFPVLARSRPLQVVVLLPSLEVVTERDTARETSGYARWSAQQLYEVFVDETPRIGLWLDTSEQTPEQTVDTILASTYHELP